MTSQHSGVKQQFTLSVVCVTTSRIDIPDTDAWLMPLSWHGMLVGFLAKLLAGLHQVLAAWRAGLVVVSTVCHFVPHVHDWRQIEAHRRPSHHQHIFMSEKVHETRNVWSSIVLLKGHVPSLTTDEGQHVRSNNLLYVAMCIQIAINNDQGWPAMGWDATHTITLPPTAKRTSLSSRMHASW